MYGPFSLKVDWRIRECENFGGETCVQISTTNRLAVEPWAGCLSLFNHGFLIWEMGLIMPMHEFLYVRYPLPVWPGVFELQAVTGGCYCCYFS